MKPRVGTPVHYRSRGSADGVFPPECRAAIVTRVTPSQTWSSEGGVVELGPLIDLCILNPTGMFFDQRIEYDGDLKPGTWHEAEHLDPPIDDGRVPSEVAT